MFQLTSLPVDKSLGEAGEVWSSRIGVEGGQGVWLGGRGTPLQAWSLRSWVPMCKAVDTHFLSLAMVRAAFSYECAQTTEKQDVSVQI